MLGADIVKLKTAMEGPQAELSRRMGNLEAERLGKRDEMARLLRAIKGQLSGSPPGPSAASSFL